MIVTILFLKITNEIQFSFMIPVHNKYCIGEYLTENTVSIFSISSSSPKLTSQVFDPKNKILYTKSGEHELKISLTATENGNYHVCINNNDKKEIEIEFEFLSGIQAQDYSEVAMESNLKPVEASVKKVEDTINLLINDLTSVTKEEDLTLKDNDNINSNIVSFSIITVAAMIAIGAVETLYLKRYLHKRKII